MAHPGGRPTKYTPKLAELICERVGTHGTGIRNICNMYDDMPSPDTINLWRYKYDEFSERYMLARRKQSHILFDSSIDDIEKIKDYYYIDPDTGASKVDSGIVAAQKALANHKTFMAAKIQPIHYGEKQQIETTIKHEENIKDLS